MNQSTTLQLASRHNAPYFDHAQALKGHKSVYLGESGEFQIVQITMLRNLKALSDLTVGHSL
jgi:hypothetical protein